MQVVLVIVCILLILLIVQGVKELRVYILSRFNKDIYDFRSVLASMLCELGAVVSISMKEQLGIDNLIVLLLIVAALLIYVLLKNIKNSTVLYGIIITIIQFLIGAFLIGFIIFIFSMLTREREKNNKKYY